MRWIFGIGLTVLLSASGWTQCVEVSLIAWNMESGDADPELLGKQMAQKGRIDLWGLSEVQSQVELDKMETAYESVIGLNYTAVLSQDGGGDRLAYLYNPTEFKQIGPSITVDTVRVRQGLRPSFGAEFEHLESGQRFIFLVNHFKCCGGPAHIATRVNQAKALNAYARAQSLPVLAVGDFNTPVPITGNELPPGLKQLIVEGPFRWIKPEVLVRTQISKATVLDFVLVANAVPSWEASSQILSREGNLVPKASEDSFSDDNQQTDHRPVLAVFQMECDLQIDALEEEIELSEARLKMLREKLARLKEHQNDN